MTPSTCANLSNDPYGFLLTPMAPLIVPKGLFFSGSDFPSPVFQNVSSEGQIDNRRGHLLCFRVICSLMPYK